MSESIHHRKWRNCHVKRRSCDNRIYPGPMPLWRLPVRDFGTYRRGSALSLRPCRRANGTAFSANARIRLERYRVIAGEDLISEYESSPGAQRCFCSRCGSPVFARVAKDPNQIRIRLGTLDREVDAEITAHVWVGSKARWDRLTWAIPSFERGIDSPPV